jgi:hypothetical protein
VTSPTTTNEWRYVWRIAYTDAHGNRDTMSDVFLNERHAADTVKMFAACETEAFRDLAVARFPAAEDTVVFVSDDA